MTQQKQHLRFGLSAALLTLGVFASGAHAAVDEDAAKALAKKNDCFKCHAVSKTKKGPSYQKVAAKYKGKEAEGEQAIFKQITTGPTVKLEDGSEQEHKIIETKDEGEIHNLIQWILGQ